MSNSILSFFSKGRSQMPSQHLQVQRSIPKAASNSSPHGLQQIRSLQDKINLNVSTKTKKAETIQEKIHSLLTNGLTYVREIRDNIEAERKNGASRWEAGQNTWEKVLDAVRPIAIQGQDKLLDEAVDDLSKQANSFIKGTFAEELLHDVLGLGDDAVHKASSSLADDAAKATATASSGALGKAGVIAGKLGSAVNVAGAAYSLYSLIDDFGKTEPLMGAMHGATVGAAVGSFIPVVGTGLGALVGGVLGAGSTFFGKGGNPERIARDDMRNSLMQVGFLDQNASITLADGTKYSFATDRQEQIFNAAGEGRFGYQIDFDNPLSHQAIGWLNPLARVMVGGDQKLATDLVGYMVNAATHNASSISDVYQNVYAIYEQANNVGLGLEALVEGVPALAGSGVISENELKAYLGGIELFVTGSAIHNGQIVPVDALGTSIPMQNQASLQEVMH